MTFMDENSSNSCERFDARSMDLMHAPPGSEAAHELRAHAESCARCRAEMALVERVAQGLRTFAVLEPAPGSTLSFMRSFVRRREAERRRRELQLVYTQAALLSLSCGVLVAVLVRLSAPLQGVLAVPWLQRVLAARPWLAGALAPLLFWLVASVLVAITAPLLVATMRKRHAVPQPRSRPWPVLAS
jgi:hypothetical protein